MLHRSARQETELAPPGATPTLDDLPRRLADFATLGESLDYAAKGQRGLNFHDARGTLTRAYPYSELREDALAHARRFDGARGQTGRPHRPDRRNRARVRRLLLRRGLCRRLAGSASAADQLRRPRILCRPARDPAHSCDPALFLFPPELAEFVLAAAAKRGIDARDWGSIDEIEQDPRDLPQAQPDDIAYLQYSSGSTRFPHGVAVSHRALLGNLHSHGFGLEVEQNDRVISWLPWYHDMGLVGCLLSPVAMQMSVDYLKTEDFARRPLAWLDLITRNPGHHAQLLADFRL